jgi:hypothetical protein
MGQAADPVRFVHQDNADARGEIGLDDQWLPGADEKTACADVMVFHSVGDGRPERFIGGSGQIRIL